MTRLPLLILGSTLLASAWAAQTRAEETTPPSSSDSKQTFVTKFTGDRSEFTCWEVTVFKGPTNGGQNYIKRLTADVPPESTRWDVTVFKGPTNGGHNYIKRLTALPGETDGVSDGQIPLRAAPLFDTIKTDGAKIEITPDAIRIEGGRVEIRRMASPK